MRNLSFALTTEQIRARTKTVTRRRGDFWLRALRPGDRVCAVEKCQGIPKGGLVRLCVIRVIGVRLEELHLPIRMSWERQREECSREGFPEFEDWWRFIGVFCRHMGGPGDQTVTRIEFEYVLQPPSADCFKCADWRWDWGLHRRGLCECRCHGPEAFR